MKKILSLILAILIAILLACSIFYFYSIHSINSFVSDITFKYAYCQDDDELDALTEEILCATYLNSSIFSDKYEECILESFFKLLLNESLYTDSDNYSINILKANNLNTILDTFDSNISYRYDFQTLLSTQVECFNYSLEIEPFNEFINSADIIKFNTYQESLFSSISSGNSSTALVYLNQLQDISSSLEQTADTENSFISSYITANKVLIVAYGNFYNAYIDSNQTLLSNAQSTILIYLDQKLTIELDVLFLEAELDNAKLTEAEIIKKYASF